MPKRLATNLLIHVDSRARGALQKQIYASMRRAIREGVLQPGTRVPSSRALAEDLGVSRTTTLLALEQLSAEGYLAAARGSGTFVARELPDDVGRAMPPPRPLSRLAHPPPSRRSAALAAVPPNAYRVPGPPKPFRLGVPALDLFPVQLWSQLANRRLRGVTTVQLDYAPMGGVRAVREAIAHYVCAARGTQCEADQIQVVTSIQAGLGLVCSVLLDPGEKAWMEDPGYPGARSALAASGARVQPVPVDEEGLDVAAGAREAGDARFAYVTPSHQFPLGVPMSLARRHELLEWASAARAWVIEDDYDSEFRYGERPVPCLHGLDHEGRVVYLGSFSKALFPSLRIGFIIVPPDLRERVAAARRAVDLHPPTLDQMVLADFIAGGHLERHLRRMRAAYRERLEALAAAAERHCAGALRLRPVRAGLHAVADLEADVDDVRVFEQARLRGVEVMPLSSYHFGGGPASNGLVLGFGAVRPDALADGMVRLAAAIEAARRA